EHLVVWDERSLEQVPVILHGIEVRARACGSIAEPTERYEHALHVGAWRLQDIQPSGDGIVGDVTKRNVIPVEGAAEDRRNVSRMEMDEAEDDGGKACLPKRAGDVVVDVWRGARSKSFLDVDNGVVERTSWP